MVYTVSYNKIYGGIMSNCFESRDNMSVEALIGDPPCGVCLGAAVWVGGTALSLTVHRDQRVGQEGQIRPCRWHLGRNGRSKFQFIQIFRVSENSELTRFEADCKLLLHIKWIASNLILLWLYSLWTFFWSKNKKIYCCLGWPGAEWWILRAPVFVRSEVLHETFRSQVYWGQYWL